MTAFRNGTTKSSSAISRGGVRPNRRKFRRRRVRPFHYPSPYARLVIGDRGKRALGFGQRTGRAGHKQASTSGCFETKAQLHVIPYAYRCRRRSTAFRQEADCRGTGTYGIDAVVTMRLRSVRAFLLSFVAMLAGADSRALPHSEAPTRVAWLWDNAAVPSWSDTEVAVVLQHIHLRGDEVLIRPRMRAPTLPPTARVTPVLHVEISSLRPPRNIEQRRDDIILAMQRAAQLSTSGWVQLDMEARPSQREFYVVLVRDIRAALPKDVSLSVTALAWWCRSDRWVNELAADEVVPMFFRMGRDSAALRKLIATEPQRLSPRCARGAAGFSSQEPFDVVTVERYRRTYWFDNRRWREPMP